MNRPRHVIARGFTLIELMIAIAVVGVISVVIYQLFDTTSQNFREVTELAHLNSRVRFATESLRNQLQAAGSQATPDSDLDDWVAPEPLGGVRIAGLIPYPGWQNDTTQLPLPIADANPKVSFDGIVVMGAYDFPLSFELSGLEGASPRDGHIHPNTRGIMKLLGQDLFMNGMTATAPAMDAATRDTLAVGATGTNWTARLLRLTDRQGFMQFVHPLSLDTTGEDYFAVSLPGDSTTLGPMFKGGPGAGVFGLDSLPEGDVGYDAGLIDAYWFHVVPDSANPNVMSLVRDRLCAAEVAARGLNGGFVPATALADACPGGERERTVIASYVADFQVWFDCADADGKVEAATWHYQWERNDHVAGDCMDAAAPDPGRVRAGHIRLALHTKTERTDQRHIQFEDAAGAVCNPDDYTCDDLRVDAAVLRTYDFFPRSEGAAQVVVMQTDFEIVNFVNRNTR